MSRTPIVLSHSGPKAMFNHPRNIDDERMRRLARAGGVMFVNSVFLVSRTPRPSARRSTTATSIGRSSNAQERAQLLRDQAALDAQRPYNPATFDMFMRSLLHAISVMGVDHVGLGADWDGGGGLIDMEDIASLPRITARLRR
jgi:membrane dipeptidase